MNLPSDIKKPILLKLNDGAYLLLDESIAKDYSSNLTGLTKCLVTSSAPKSSNLLNEQEKKVLMKINQIRFDQRTPQKIDSLLSDEEKKVYESMTKKGYVRVYKKGKYSTHGVVAIDRKVYDQIKQTSTNSKPSKSFKSNTSDVLSKGYLILSSSGEAQRISNSLEKEIKAGQVLGVRGFDKSYYIIKSDLCSDIRNKLLDKLEESDMTLDELVSKTSCDKGACRCVLNILVNDGEIIEKKKDEYSKI